MLKMGFFGGIGGVSSGVTPGNIVTAERSRCYLQARAFKPIAVTEVSDAACAASAAGATAATDLLTIFSGITFNTLLSSEVGLTLDVGGGGGVATWVDQSTAGKSATQVTPSAQAVPQAAGLNGKQTLLFDGVTQRMAFAGLNLAAPGTTPSFFYGVMRIVTDATNVSPFGCGSTTMRLFRGSANNLRITNGTNGPLIPYTPNAWFRFMVRFGNSAGDYLKVGSASLGVQVNTGNTDPGAGALILGAYLSSGTGVCKVEFASFACLQAEPSGPQLSAADAWVTARYGAGVAV